MISFGDDDIVVGEVEKGDGAMEPIRVPGGLRERLGEDGTAGLVELFQTAGRAWREDVLSVVTERFERRLTEAISGLRVEMANGFASLRQEMTQGLAQLRQKIAATKVDLIKWSFVFWTGQVVVLGGLMAIMR